MDNIGLAYQIENLIGDSFSNIVYFIKVDEWLVKIGSASNFANFEKRFEECSRWVAKPELIGFVYCDRKAEKLIHNLLTSFRVQSKGREIFTLEHDVKRYISKWCDNQFSVSSWCTYNSSWSFQKHLEYLDELMKDAQNENQKNFLNATKENANKKALEQIGLHEFLDFVLSGNTWHIVEENGAINGTPEVITFAQKLKDLRKGGELTELGIHLTCGYESNLTSYIGAMLTWLGLARTSKQKTINKKRVRIYQLHQQEEQEEYGNEDAFNWDVLTPC
jgi:hypothetical protein